MSLVPVEAKKPRPIIMAIPDPVLTDEVRAVIEDVRPVGFIIFNRTEKGNNCVNAYQLEKLISELSLLAPTTPPLMFIDQEGGRVARIRWDVTLPPATDFGKAYDKNPDEALEWARLGGFITAVQLARYGITANCAPVADVAHEMTHNVIGDRAYHSNPEIVSKLCSAVISGHMAGGVWPVIKHAPGHGRADCDSHTELPVVTADKAALESDSLPFKDNAMCPFVMTAHIEYPEWDANCATNSKYILKDIIQGAWGMKGLIISDDVGMNALEGGVPERIMSALDAGCDLVLECSADIDVMKTLTAVPEVSEELMQRLEKLPSLTVPEAEIVKEALVRYMALTEKYTITHAVAKDPTLKEA